MIDTAEKIIETIETSNKPIICMDSRADFDALCSSIIMHDYLTKKLGKDVTVTFDGVIPDLMRQLVQDYANIDFLQENVCPATDVDFTKHDLHIFLDSGTAEHICKDEKYVSNPNIKKLNIDHHAGNPLYGNLNYVKPLASTCTVLFELFNEAGIEINKDMASIYYLGLILDSGFFQYDTVTNQDFYMASVLKKLGAECYEITWKLNFNEKPINLKLKGLVFSNMVILPELKVAYSTISLDELKVKNIDFKQTTYPPSDMIKTVENTDFVFVVREDENDHESFNLSFRSHRKDFDVLKLAQHFGGGGHKMAAGGTIKANDISAAVMAVLNYIKSL